MNSDNFKLFIDFLNAHSLLIDDGELRVTSSIGKKLIENILTDIGYEFDDIKTLRHGCVNISLNAASWSVSPIYNSWDDLFSKVERTTKLPVNFYILDTKESSFDDTQMKRALELFCSMRQLLASLADQCDPPTDGHTKGFRKLFYLVEIDDGVAKYEFQPTITWEDLIEIPTNDRQLSLVEKMREVINLGDSQDSERRSVMRSAFHEIISTCSNRTEIFKKVLGSIENFNKRYDEHYELFVKRFSINKILHEINDKDLTYTSKINEILSSAQNQALTIPAALIVIGAVMRIDQMADGFAIAFAILITTSIVHRSLSVHQSTFLHIEKQVIAEFKRYDVLNEKVEIRKRAKQTIKDLTDLIRKAKFNSKLMKYSIWAVCIASIFYITFALNVDSNSQVKNDSTVLTTDSSMSKSIDKENKSFIPSIIYLNCNYIEEVNSNKSCSTVDQIRASYESKKEYKVPAAPFRTEPLEDIPNS